MISAILVLVIGLAIFWLVFFMLRLTPAWGFGFALVFAHFFLIFLIGPEVRHAQLRERHGGAAHDPAHSALARANPGD